MARRTTVPARGQLATSVHNARGHPHQRRPGGEEGHSAFHTDHCRSRNIEAIPLFQLAIPPARRSYPDSEGERSERYPQGRPGRHSTAQQGRPPDTHGGRAGEGNHSPSEGGPGGIIRGGHKDALRRSRPRRWGFSGEQEQEEYVEEISPVRAGSVHRRRRRPTCGRQTATLVPGLHWEASSYPSQRSSRFRATDSPLPPGGAPPRKADYARSRAPGWLLGNLWA